MFYANCSTLYYVEILYVDTLIALQFEGALDHVILSNWIVGLTALEVLDKIFEDLILELVWVYEILLLLYLW